MRGDLQEANSSLGQTVIERDTAAKDRDTANATIATLNGTLATAQQGGLQAVLTEDPSGLWTSMKAIWSAFPNSSLCGFSKSSYASAGYYSYDFTLFNC